MSEDIRAGDVVVCVDASECGDRGTPNSGLLVDGGFYRVSCLGFPVAWAPEGDICCGLILAGIRSVNPDGSFHPDRFRKLNDEPDNAELIERIRRCRPVKSGVSA
jgi:hypothetical protein